MPGVAGMGLKKKTRQEPGTLKWGWLEGLYLSQEKKKKKKLNPALWSFKVANPQIHSCLLFS